MIKNFFKKFDLFAPEASVISSRTTQPVIESSPTQVAQPQSGQLEFDWVHIPAGPFLIGSDLEEDSLASDDETPQCKIELPDFYIARTPVTNQQYQKFVTATGHRKPEHWKNGKIPNGKDDHPVVWLTWQDTYAFCEWADVVLPNEAEWEKAARGDDGRLYPWGNETPTPELCNFDKHIGDTTPVGHYSQGSSPYGCLDMAGNVWEWVNTVWGYSYPYDASDGRETLDLSDAAKHVVRGGAWNSDDRTVRCAMRHWYRVGQWRDYYGFRVKAILQK